MQWEGGGIFLLEKRGTLWMLMEWKCCCSYSCFCKLLLFLYGLKTTTYDFLLAGKNIRITIEEWYCLLLLFYTYISR